MKEVTCMGEMRFPHCILVGKPEEKTYLGKGGEVW